ncbi:MAG: type II secretion system protein GspK [Gammaproteobacteria bacterium]|nr:MAG: type II secretion system protein GspK [Gammaproteobacteria bacterium]
MKSISIHRVQRGFALIIVLWAGVLLSVVAASFAFSMRVETRLAANLTERAQAEAIADAGIRRGIVALLADASGPRWVADGRAYELPLGDGSMRIRLLSENGKIDLNGAPEALIQGLLRVLAENGELSDTRQAARIADAILDWRDPDKQVRADGAEDRNYKASGRPFGSRDGAFLSVAELNQVLGVDSQVYARLAPWLTVYSWAPQVDPMTAPRTVLLAVPGLDAGQVDGFIAARQAFYARRSAGGGERSRLPVELLSAGARYLSRAESRVYTVEAEGELPGGTRASRRAVIQLSGDPRKPFSTVAWFDSIADSETDTEILKRR